MQLSGQLTPFVFMIENAISKICVPILVHYQLKCSRTCHLTTTEFQPSKTGEGNLVTSKGHISVCNSIRKP